MQQNTGLDVAPWHSKAPSAFVARGDLLLESSLHFYFYLFDKSSLWYLFFYSSRGLIYLRGIKDFFYLYLGCKAMASGVLFKYLIYASMLCDLFKNYCLKKVQLCKIYLWLQYNFLWLIDDCSITFLIYRWLQYNFLWFTFDCSITFCDWSMIAV